MQALLERWRSRLLFGVLLLTYGEFVGWQTLPQNSLQDWGAILVIYIAIMGVVLDVYVRWYVDDTINTLLAAGIFGILHGTIISTNLARNLPLSIIIFGTATPALMFLLAHYSFRLLYSADNRFRWLYFVLPFIGLVQGIWTRWLPQTNTVNIDIPSLFQILLPTLCLFMFCGILPLLQPTLRITQLDWMLTPYEAALCFGILGVAIFSRINEATLNTFALLVGAILLLTFAGLARLYQTTLTTSLKWEILIKPQKIYIVYWWVAFLLFGIGAVIGYNLPQHGTDSFQATLMVGGLIIFGMLWPPFVSFWVSMQAFIELGRQEF